jgi:hypothetical protein
MAWGTWVHQVLLYTLVFVQGKARVRGLHSSRSTSEIDLVYRYKCVPGTWAKTNKNYYWYHHHWFYQYHLWWYSLKFLMSTVRLW